MNLFERIAIGTANWGQEYNGSKLSDSEIDKILGYMQCSGIDTIETATAYGWSGWRDVPSYFKIVLKIRSSDWPVLGLMEYGDRVTLMAHNASEYRELYVCSETLRSASLYKPNELKSFMEKIEVPYSLYDRRFEDIINRYDGTIFVRSVFLRGKIIQDGIPAQECIKFCFCNPYVDKVIIGVDSVEQLQRNLDFLWRWQGLEKNDEKLLDPRRWKNGMV